MDDLRELERTIRAFVELVLGDMKGNAVVGLMDRAGSRGQLNRFKDYRYPEQLDQIVQFGLEHRNEDAYLSPLIYGDMRDEETGRLRRIPENALFSGSVYQDSDTCPMSAFRLPPSIHVTTSSGRYQDYWILTEPIPAQEAADISHRVAIAHRDQGSDPSSWSANKLLRIPGTSNTRHGFPEIVEAQFTGEIYNSYDIAGAYDDIDFESRPLLRLPADVSYESERDLPDYAAALDKLPASFDVGFITREVPTGADRSIWRYRLLCDLFRAGLEFDYVLSLAWHAPASRKWREDSRNIRGLISEALKAQQEVATEPEVSTLPPSVNDTFVPDITLLNEQERDSIAGDSNWIERWTQWNAHKLGAAFNRPYVRLNGWSVLSAAFSDTVFIPRDNGPEYCNLFTIGIGDSGSGKSSALKLWRVMMGEIFEQDKAWDIGANFSPNALHEALLQRDKKVSIVNADEAHGWFRQIVGQPWAEGILEVIARYFDGFVPPMLRTTGARDLNGKTAETYFLMHMFGTRRGELSLTHVLDKSMILSGFLPRCIWAIGEDRRLTESSFAETQANGEYVNSGFEPQLRQWAAEFANTKKIMRTRAKRQYIPMMMDNDALARLGRAKWQIVQELRDHPQWELLDPSVIRIGNNIRRAATLLAAEEGATSVTLRHTLVAIREAEKWLKDMVVMTLSLSASIFQRDADQIHDFILNKGGNVRREVVARKFAATRPRDLEEQLEALVGQGRITKKTREGATWLTIQAAT